MSAPIIEVRELSKRYLLGAIGARTLRGQIGRGWDRMRGREVEAPGEFWALRDVSFQVMPGEVMGVVGRNGSGKSTLLKLLSRITIPTRGQIRLRGRVGSLLEVGTGFHPELTGRENVFMNGTILGMKKREVAAKFDEIVAFSGIERFIDTPVKRYSSGMSVRLAFAVAAHLEPDILIIDEVLAVGDSAFQEKCLGKMDDVARLGRTILFVSHQMGSVSRLCTRGLYLSAGRVLVDAPVEEVVETYIRENASGRAGMYVSGSEREGTARVLASRLLDAEGRQAGEVDFDRPHRIEVRVDVAGQKDVSLSLAVADSSDRRLFATRVSVPASEGERVFRLVFPAGALLPGGYHVQLALVGPHHHAFDLVPLAFRYTLSDLAGNLADLPHGGPGAVSIPARWESVT